MIQIEGVGEFIPRQEVGRCNCRMCDTVCHQKVNKNGIVYYYCPHCKHHERWGGENSIDILKKFKGVQNEKNNTSDGTRNNANNGTGNTGNTGTGERAEQPRKRSVAEQFFGG